MDECVEWSNFAEKADEVGGVVEDRKGDVSCASPFASIYLCGASAQGRRH